MIEHRPEPPSPHAVKGTLVHAALEGLFWNHDAADRTQPQRHTSWEWAWKELAIDPEFVELGLTTENAASFLADAHMLIDNYFRLEDPSVPRTRLAWSSESRSSRTACGCAASSTASTSALTAR